MRGVAVFVWRWCFALPRRLSNDGPAGLHVTQRPVTSLSCQLSVRLFNPTSTATPMPVTSGLFPRSLLPPPFISSLIALSQSKLKDVGCRR